MNRLYWKGHKKGENGYRVIGVSYENPVDDYLFDLEFQHEVWNLDSGGFTRYLDYDEVEKEYYISRYIGYNEYIFLHLLSQLETEIFMNQFSGGFPRIGTCTNILRQLSRGLNDVCQEQNEEQMDKSKKPVKCVGIYPKGQYMCPTCGTAVTYFETYMHNRAFGDLERIVRLDRCARCGQNLDWEDL